MLYRHEDYAESYVHICGDVEKYNRKYIAERPRVVVHDISTKLIVDNKSVNIKYCPFCGCDPQQDEMTGKYYKF